MKLCIATFSNADYAPVCAVTNPNKAEYAARHGYTFQPHVTKLPYHQLFFARYDWYLSLLKSNQYDWLLCCDGDVIFTNFTIPAESLIQSGDHFVIARDALMVQAGVFLVRNSPQGRSIIRRIASLGPRFKRKPTSDQSAMEMTFPHFPLAVRFVPQRKLQSYEYGLYANLGGNYAKGLDADGNDGQWRVGDFALHVPAVMDQKIKVLTEHLPLVVK